MSKRTVGRIFTAAMLTATLAIPLPARAETAHRRPVPRQAWQWLTDLWSGSFGPLFPALSPRQEPAGTKQGPMIDPNGGGITTDSCTVLCDQGPMIDPNG
jgi:hypothetical protein